MQTSVNFDRVPRCVKCGTENEYQSGPFTCRKCVVETEIRAQFGPDIGVSKEKIGGAGDYSRELTPESIALGDVLVPKKPTVISTRWLVISKKRDSVEVLGQGGAWSGRGGDIFYDDFKHWKLATT